MRKDPLLIIISWVNICIKLINWSSFEQENPVAKIMAFRGGVLKIIQTQSLLLAAVDSLTIRMLIRFRVHRGASQHGPFNRGTILYPLVCSRTLRAVFYLTFQVVAIHLGVMLLSNFYSELNFLTCVAVQHSYRTR